MCVSWETRITKVYFFRTCCYQILEEYLVSLAVLWIWENIASLFFSNYRLCVECSSLARSALHSSYMRHSTAQLAIKSQKRNSILANFYFRKSENCPMHSDPTKLICVTPSEWIRWYRRYDNLKHSLFECVREKMLTLWKREVPYSTFPLELGF